METLRSVESQVYERREVILVDDGSTDSTATLVRERFPDVRYVYQPNRGQPAARNTGIRNAVGDWIAFVDSDDLWRPDKLDFQVALLDQKKNYFWCYSDAAYFDHSPENPLYRLSQVVRPESGRVLAPLFLGNFICSSSPIIHRRVFEDVGMWDEDVRLCEDWNMWLRVAAKISSCVCRRAACFLSKISGDE